MNTFENTVAPAHGILASKRLGSKPSRTRRQRGFTLIEILVAMLVAAFGILGVVGMNAASIKLQADSANRSQAALYAQDIFDRMRANRERALLGEYNRAITDAVPAVANPVTMPNLDLRAWLTNLQRSLPNASASVNVTATGDATVVIQWAERQNRGSDAGNLSFTFASSL